MITKFDSSYYGTAEMENLGYAGTPINERRYSQAELGRALHTAVAYAKCMDERRDDSVVRAGHQFQPARTHPVPRLRMIARRQCVVPKQLCIGCGLNHLA